MISVYSAAYNICKFGFDYEKNIRNWCDLAGAQGQVVIAVNTSEDDTWKKLVELTKICWNLELIKTDVSYSNNRIDGLTKTAALKECKLPIQILMDLDEYFLHQQKEIWYEVAQILLESQYDGLLIPSLDLWGNINHIRKKEIGQKFRIHKNTIKSRGVIKQAELGDGFFDTSKSDNTEALLENGNLGLFAQVVPPGLLQWYNSKHLINFPLTIHESYLDLERKANHGKLYWKEMWEKYSNKEENVATEKSQLEAEEVIEHGLNLE